MRKGWEYKKLGEIAKCAIGLTYKPENVTEELSGTIVLRSSNIQNSILDFNDIVRVNVPVKEDKIVKDGDILMCSRNGSIRLVGKVALIKNLKERMSYGAFMTIIRSQYNPYLFEYFKTPAFRQYLIAGKTTTVNQITVKMLNNLTIPLPPKSTQLAIVSELDKINELIRLKKEQLKDFDNLAQSLFYEMFGDPVENEMGWEVKTFGEIGSVERGAGISKKDFVKEGLPCIHYGQLHTILGPRTTKHFTSIPHNLLPKYKIAHTGDLVMAITSEDVEGSCKSTVWLGDYDIIVGSDAAIFHHKQDGTFLSYYTMTKAFFNEKAKYAKGFKVTHISAKEIEKIPVYLPPLPLQRLFALRIEQIEREKSEVQKSIQDLETLLASRMQYWFE